MPSRSNQGFQLQLRLTRAILRRFRDWNSVVITDGRGRAITRAEDVPMVRDGGVDLLIQVRTDLPPRTQKAVETRLRRIMESESFE